MSDAAAAAASGDADTEPDGAEGGGHSQEEQRNDGDDAAAPAPAAAAADQPAAVPAPSQETGAGAESCPICFETVDPDEAAMHCVGSGGLRHRFHGQCLAGWVESCRGGARQPSCPVCRGPVEIHAQRLESQAGAAGAGVREFLSQHAPRSNEGDSADGGWVRVGPRLSILEALRTEFDSLDDELSFHRVQGRSSRSAEGGNENATSSSSSGAQAGAPVPAATAAASSSGLTDDPIEDVADDGDILGSSEAPWPSRAPCDIDARAVRSAFVVSGVHVRFPFAEILPPQRDVITNTVNAALRGRHVLIESPTGTGKTIALLCAALAAQHHLAERFSAAPRIVFCTRTHHQIKQVVREARLSPYRPWLQIVGGRDQGLCTEAEVIRQAQAEQTKSSQVCRLARRKAEQRNSGPANVVGADGRLPDQDENRAACRVWTPLLNSGVIRQAHRAMRASATEEVVRDDKAMLDLEDLGDLGQRLGACPYFLSRVALPRAELVICPYNYVLEPSISASTGLLDEKAIIIIDEGHNLEDYCCDAGSVCIGSSVLSEIDRRIDETLRYLIDFHSDEGVDLHTIELVKSTVQSIQNVCSRAVDAFYEVHGSQQSADRCTCRTWNSTIEPAPTILDFLDSCQIYENFASDVKAFQTTLQQRSSTGAPRLDGLAIQVMQALAELESLATALELCKAKPSQYKVHVEAIRETRASQIPIDGAGRARWMFELSVVLVHPESIFQRVAEAAHCVVIASGTLAPTASFSAELGSAFTGRLLRSPVEATHIISQSQLGLAFVGRSRLNVELRCVRERFQQRSFLMELGRTVVEVAATIPGGVLVFLPSRQTLEVAVSAWQESSPGLLGGRSLWQVLEHHKPLVAVEGSDGAQALAAHERAALQQGGAVLFCVYRGRSSEGVSLSDHAVRGVVCVGIPLPPLRPAVRLKRDYNDALARNAAPGTSLNGDAWYNLGAHRAVNQALGRAVRHRADYGAVVLIDSRWTAEGSLRAVKYLPLWLRNLMGITNAARGERLGCALERLLEDLRRHFAAQASAAVPATAAATAAAATAAAVTAAAATAAAAVATAAAAAVPAAPAAVSSSVAGRSTSSGAAFAESDGTVAGALRRVRPRVHVGYESSA
eukprot:TRINITY_DN26684_c0_g1_i1.p1 TRINITY_DN26684_c0_g1~~TRINITY_DN26684_c0_g1_i1.p1  ORF type:complete len:1123 (-),score=213.67 TRINITY_DN26684_c0_g1_i1:504-3872(-)